MLFDEFAAGFDLVAHQDAEELVGGADRGTQMSCGPGGPLDTRTESGKLARSLLAKNTTSCIFMSAPRQFTAAEVRKITGVRQRALDYWDETDFLKPSGERRTGNAKRGRGTKRLYTFDDLIKIRTVVRLRQAGVWLGRIREAQGKLSPNGPGLLLQTVGEMVKKSSGNAAMGRSWICSPAGK